MDIAPGDIVAHVTTDPRGFAYRTVAAIAWRHGAECGGEIRSVYVYHRDHPQLGRELPAPQGGGAFDCADCAVIGRA